MRICLLNPCYWPEVRRGSERVIRELASDLIGRGHEVRLVTAHAGLPRRRTEDGLDVLRLPRLLDGYLARRRVQEYITHTPLSYVALQLAGDDIAHACFPTDAWAALRWAHATGKPAVFSYNGLPNRPAFAAKRGRLKILSKAIYESDAVVVPSRAAAREMKRWFGRDPRVIHPGVDLDVFTPGHGRAHEPTIVCAAPWEDGRKRVPLLVEAFKEVRRARPSARLVLLRPKSPAVGQQLLGEPGIELLEPLEQPRDMARVYRRAWVSALTSYNEAFGLVLCEALACGTAVVAEDLGGPQEIVDRQEIGRLFADSEPHVIARSLLEALELSESPATAAACREAASRFSTSRCGAEHEQLYRELIVRGDRRGAR